jgi:hypothetical protein
VPYFVDGDYDDFINSLEALKNGGYENVVQGHGEVVLRGEVDEVIQNDLNYLTTIKRLVEAVVANHLSVDALNEITIEECGKSRIPLNGLVQDLHLANLNKLYEKLTAQRHG